MYITLFYDIWLLMVPGFNYLYNFKLVRHFLQAQGDVVNKQ